MSHFPTLFAPFQSGRLKLKSRLVMLPHSTGMVSAGASTEDEFAYIAARANESLGLLITGAAAVSPSSVLRHYNLLEGWNEKNRDGLRRRSDIVHKAGGQIFGQIFHVGRETVGGEPRTIAVAPSAVRSPRDVYPPHALDAFEIEDIIADFVTTARNFELAGYDGVELHAAHGYLIGTFLSPATNRRDDAWGGTPEKRFRFLREIITAVREACAPGFGVGVRLSADEQIPEGLDVRDTVAIAKAIAAHGGVDYLNITLGVRGSYVKDATFPDAPAARAAGIIRQECGLPILLAQKIASPQLAEELLASGVADLIGMARAFVAEPTFATKAATGEEARIRPCVGLNQDCRAFIPHLHCAVNPRTGREALPEFGPLRKAEARKRVAIVGGGPGGMEAARVAAVRGHSVTLFEASDRLGGQFLYAASLPHRGGLIRIIDHLIGELRHEGVTVAFNMRIDDVAALSSAFDHVIVASGASPNPLEEQPRSNALRSWFDIVSDGAPKPFGQGRAVFADDGAGFWFSYGAAEALVTAGWQVTFVTPSGAIGVGLPHESVSPLLVRLARGNTEYRVLSTVRDVEGGEATVVNITSGNEHRTPCDLLVMQTGRTTNPVPHSAPTRAERSRIVPIGDCVAPRRISHAMLEAQRAARAI